MVWSGPGEEHLLWARVRAERPCPHSRGTVQTPRRGPQGGEGEADPGGGQWGLQKLSDYKDALCWVTTTHPRSHGEKQVKM